MTPHYTRNATTSPLDDWNTRIFEGGLNDVRLEQIRTYLSTAGAPTCATRDQLKFKFDEAIRGLPNSMSTLTRASQLAVNQFAALLLTPFFEKPIPQEIQVKENKKNSRPYESVMRTMDYSRTKAFVDGIKFSIDELLRVRDEPIYGLEINGGSLGVLSMAAVLRSRRVHMTLVESDPYSALCVQHAVSHWNLNEQITVLCADVANVPTPHRPFDLVVCDSFEPSLLGTSIVSDLQSVKPYVAAHGILVPYGVAIRASVTSGEVSESLHLGPGNVYVYKLPTCFQSSAGFNHRFGEACKEVRLQLELYDIALLKRHRLLLTSAVEVTPGRWIQPQKSHLTRCCSFEIDCGKIDCGNTKEETPGLITVNYRPGTEPERVGVEVSKLPVEK